MSHATTWRKLTDSSWAFLTARLALGGTMIWSGIQKIDDPVAFLKAIHHYEIFPAQAYVLMNLTAAALPWVELICGSVLLLGVFSVSRGAAALTSFMLFLFTSAIAIRAYRIMESTGTPLFDIRFDCGCGSFDNVIIWQKLLLNTVLILLSLLVLSSHSRFLGWPRPWKKNHPSLALKAPEPI